MSPTLQIWAIVAAGALFLLLLSSFPPSFAMSTAALPLLGDFSDSWMARLLVNLMGYSTVLIPGFLIKRYVTKTNYMDSAGKGCTRTAVIACLYGDESDRSLGTSTSAEKEAAAAAMAPTVSTAQRLWRLLFCFFGLQLSYLTWGVLQEKIMTLDYGSGAEEGQERFTDSQFLVFVNRILAFVLSGAYLLLRRQPRHSAPLYKYSFCSFSNIMSSWCQYEALKYVSFPTQVLAKACKIIPVMIMGRLVSRRTYEFYEYVTAALISVGMTMFLLGTAEGGGHHGVTSMTTFSGVVILAAYMAFDSFTSNWQGELFRQHHMSSMQMMCGVNLFSCLFTAVSLLQQGGFVESFYFTLRHHKFFLDIVLLSLTSATGQLFIFHTISRFGPIVFIIMMTVRQGLAILLSVVLYHHAITAIGILGVTLVFTSVFLRIYCGERQKQLRARWAQQPPVDVCRA